MREKGGACDHFGMHLPFFVFAEVFKEEESIRMTKKTFSCTNPSDYQENAEKEVGVYLSFLT